MRQWYVVKTKPRKEDQVLRLLSRQGIEVYLPKIRRRKRAGDKPWEPLFPGYLFAALALDGGEGVMARWIPGVAYLLGYGGMPWPVPEELLARIKARLATGAAGLPPRFQPGQRVLIDEGPFAGLEAVFEGTLSPVGRCWVLLEILGRSVPVQIETDWLKKAG